MKSILRAANRKLLPGHLLYAPGWLVLGVNNICNLHCKMCDVGTKSSSTNFAVNLTGTQPMNMPPELFRRIADQAARYYPRVKIGYAFTEPLIYPHLEETLRYASDKHLYTAITTNALNLPQKAEILASSGLNELFISLDGPQDIHNATRGHKSSYQRAIAGIEQLLTISHIPVSVFCVITEWNIGHLHTFLENLRRLPLKHVGLLHANFVTEENAALHNSLFGTRFPATSSNIEEVNFAAYDLDMLATELQAISATSYPFPVSLHPPFREKTDLVRYYHHPEQKAGRSCPDVFSNLMIKSDGSVIPAHGRCFNVSAGNIYHDELNKIWNAEVLRDLRKTLLENGGLLPACNRCCSAV